VTNSLGAEADGVGVPLLIQYKTVTFVWVTAYLSSISYYFVSYYLWNATLERCFLYAFRTPKRGCHLTYQAQIGRRVLQTFTSEGANLGLGCGNPVALASLKEGHVVLDLGFGAGFDTFLAAARVGSSGRKVIGVDMTHEMIEKAKKMLQKPASKTLSFGWERSRICQYPMAKWMS